MRKCGFKFLHFHNNLALNERKRKVLKSSQIIEKCEGAEVGEAC